MLRGVNPRVNERISRNLEIVGNDSRRSEDSRKSAIRCTVVKYPGCLDSACVTLRSLESGANCIIGAGNYEQSGAASADVNIQ